jgi:hypothetical protein
MNSTIIQKRAYLAFVVDDGLVMDDAKVDELWQWWSVHKQSTVNDM